MLAVKKVYSLVNGCMYGCVFAIGDSFVFKVNVCFPAAEEGLTTNRLTVEATSENKSECTRSGVKVILFMDTVQQTICPHSAVYLLSDTATLVLSCLQLSITDRHCMKPQFHSTCSVHPYIHDTSVHPHLLWKCSQGRRCHITNNPSSYQLHLSCTTPHYLDSSTPFTTSVFTLDSFTLTDHDLHFYKH